MFRGRDEDREIEGTWLGDRSKVINDVKLRARVEDTGNSQKRIPVRLGSRNMKRKSTPSGYSSFLPEKMRPRSKLKDYGRVSVLGPIEELMLWVTVRRHVLKWLNRFGNEVGWVETDTDQPWGCRQQRWEPPWVPTETYVQRQGRRRRKRNVLWCRLFKIRLYCCLLSSSRLRIPCLPIISPCNSWSLPMNEIMGLFDSETPKCWLVVVEQKGFWLCRRKMLATADELQIWWGA